MDKKEASLQTFNKGFNCAQSVLTPFVQDWGLDLNMVMRLSSGFGAGMGRMQQTCGAVTGAFMVLGLKYGSDNYAIEPKEKVIELIREFSTRFKEKFGHTDCSDLLKVDLATIEGQLQFSKRNLHAKVCSNCVSSSVKILEELIQDH